MTKVMRTDTNEVIGFLDDPRCRGPLPKDVRHVTFQGWRQDDYTPWQHQPVADTSGHHARPSSTHLFNFEVINIAEPEITLLVQPQDVAFIKAHPFFKATAP
jgi:hypothetical protein